MNDKKRYTVKEFVDTYNKTADDLRETLISGVMNNRYVNYEEKVAICNKIVEKSCYVKDVTGEKRLHFNSPGKYMTYCLWLIKEYTVLDPDSSNSLEDFNLLNKTGLLDLLIKSIDQRELEEFRMVLDLVESDLIQNEYEPHTYIGKQIDRIAAIADSVGTPIVDTLQNVVGNIRWKEVLKFAKGNGLVKGKL